MKLRTVRPMAWLLITMLLPVTTSADKHAAIPGITGTDNRQIIHSTAYPWSAIGRVNNTLGPHCTGTLIGPRQVLTAAHCLWNKRTGRWLPPCALHFVAGYRGGNYLAHSLISGYHIAGQSPESFAGVPANPAQDWAVLTLAEDLGNTVGIISVADLDAALLESYQQRGGTFMQAGYSRDAAHALTANLPCPIVGFAAKGKLLFHACDASFGDSGSPILLKLGNAYSVVAVIIGIERSSRRGIAVSGASFYPTLSRLPPPPRSPADNQRPITAC